MTALQLYSILALQVLALTVLPKTMEHAVLSEKSTVTSAMK